MRGFPARGRGSRRIRGATLAFAFAIAGILLVPGALLAATEQPAVAPPQPVAPTPVGAPAAAAGAKTVSGDPTAQTVDQEPPQAVLVVNPEHPTAGEPLQLDAHASTGAIVRYRWDLDGDGTFETDSGTQATLERTLEAGSHRLAVRVEDAAGRSDESVATVTVAAPPQPSIAPAPAAAPQPPPAKHAKATAQPTVQPTVTAAAASSVTIQNFAFAPATVTVNTGDTVTWTNKDSTPHTATGGGFNTGTLKQGQSGSHTFQTAGSFSYICAIHPNMKGTVVVKGASSSGGSSGSSGGTSSAGSGGGSSSTPTAPSASGTSSSSAASGSSLPDTGLDLLVVVLVGLALTGTGLVLRKLLEPPAARG